MRRLEELLLTRSYYKVRLTELESSVVHNNASKQRKKYFQRRIHELEEKIVEELDNESK